MTTESVMSRWKYVLPGETALRGKSLRVFPRRGKENDKAEPVIFGLS